MNQQTQKKTKDSCGRKTHWREGCPREGSETQVQHIRVGQVKIAGGKLKRGTHKGDDKSLSQDL